MSFSLQKNIPKQQNNVISKTSATTKITPGPFLFVSFLSHVLARVNANKFLLWIQSDIQNSSPTNINFSFLAWTEEPGRLQSMGSLRVGHDWATSHSLFTFMLWEGNGNPLQCPCLENPRDGGAWWAAVYGVAQSWTRLKWLSSSSSLYL